LGAKRRPQSSLYIAIEQSSDPKCPI